MSIRKFQEEILEGIPKHLPPLPKYDYSINHAPKRVDILSLQEKQLAVKNALRYFPKELHPQLAPEFASELQQYGRIYMYRYRPSYPISARSIDHFPHKSIEAAAIMLMLSNNLDEVVAQHPHELITYGGNGAVFQNWAQYRLTMKYLAEMESNQTLVLNSGHPLGLFPSSKDSPRVVVSNGITIPNYSKKEDWDRLNALGVSQYGQMTAGSFMYIGPQGIVHGTTITILNALRMREKKSVKRALFISSGLGGMSGAQPKAGKIAGTIAIIAEVNRKAIDTRYSQGWVDEIYSDLDLLVERVKLAQEREQVLSIAYHGNIVELWEKMIESKIDIDLGSDQTSLHNPYSGGYYPVGYSFEESNRIMAEEPERFKELVKHSLQRHVEAINSMSKRGTYFFDYGNAFLLEASRAGADILNRDGEFKYPSYVQDIMGPLFFDWGFGPFRWVCTSSLAKDLALTDQIAAEVLEQMLEKAPPEIEGQLKDNLRWIREAQENRLVVGSQARILYADSEGRVKIALALNRAIGEGKIEGPIVLGRDHHDVSGTDSPFRETSNIYDGSQFTADMAMQNVIGDSFRGATWVSIHNGGGVGWGEAINGGFGLVIDGSKEAEKKIKNMLHWDVNNGVARRAWGRNSGALKAIEREMERSRLLKITLPQVAEDRLIELATNHIFNGEAK
ncbi:MAG: urocanate hydratase [Bacteroidales bacterium]